MIVFRNIRLSENLKTALTLYYDLCYVIARKIKNYMSIYYFCNKCYVVYENQCDCIKPEEEKLNELFYGAFESIRIDLVLNEWLNQLIRKGINRDILSIPVNWREDSDFLEDIRSCVLESDGSETN